MVLPTGMYVGATKLCRHPPPGAAVVVHLCLLRPNQKRLSFRPQRKRSGGIFPSSRFDLASVISATWVDSSTPLRSGRNDIPERWFCLSAQVVYATFPGTAHRPFPTVSLVGGTVEPHGLYLLRGMAMNHRRYIAYFHSTAQVVSGTWRAADCRPYVKFVP